MTQLQETALSLLTQFVDICEKYGLTYYLVCGSALGAVKYSGFIPWDDDIDVAMPRVDYERFLQIAQDLLPDHLFLQNYRTDPKVPFFYSKLRNSQTTFIENSTKHISMNHGVYMDIFPLDGYPKDSGEQKKFERKKLWHQLKLSCAYSSKRSWKSKLVYIAGCMLGWKKQVQRITKAQDVLFSGYSLESSDLWCNHGNWQGKLEYAPKEQYGAGAWSSFEGLKVRIPEQADAYLTQKYGQWREELPRQDQRGHHYYTVLDLDNPYTMYVKADSDFA